ncbi:MAG: squalene/phytoene synthase family protein [Geminicoccaceae bacterium]
MPGLDLAAQAREQDSDRWLCALFVPAERRDAAMALILLNAELARIPEVVSQPITGAIRYQWWRETIEGAAAGRPRAHPVAVGLAGPLARGWLAAADLEALVDAREADLETLAPDNLDQLERYAAATAGQLQVLTAKLLGADARLVEAARRAGTAFGLVGLVRAAAAYARQSRLVLPSDLMASAAVDAEALAARRMSAGLADVVRRVVMRAGLLLEPRSPAPREQIAALLPAVVARDHVRQIRRAGYDPFVAAGLARGPLVPARLWLAAALGRA